MGLQELIQTIKPLMRRPMKPVWRYNAVAKPVGSLGKLEELLERVAAVYGDPCVDIRKSACWCSAAITECWHRVWRRVPVT